MKFYRICAITIFLAAFGCSSSSRQSDKLVNQFDDNRIEQDIQQNLKDTFERTEKSDSEWEEILSENVYHIARQAGTERAFSGEYWDNYKTGTYYCRCCKLALFDSETKFQSGTGWPSFYAPIKEKHIQEEIDNKHGWNRVEVLCAGCDAHLGHVFDDGPEPTGLRYCLNSAVLLFVKK